jgi:hypothetical protein
MLVRLRSLAAAAALALAAPMGAALAPAAALAADPVYLPGSRFGFAPAPDMELSKRFTGFERKTGGATVSVVELPPAAFRDLSASLNAESLKAQGMAMKTREDVKLAGGPGVLFIGEQAGEQPAGSPTVRKWVLLASDPGVTGLIIGQAVPDALSDDAMRAMLTSVSVRPALSVEQQVDALPFRIGERAGFRPVRVLGGNSILLTDGPKDQMIGVDQPILVLAEAVQPPPPAEQRDAFARAALYANQTMKDFVIERSQGYRQDGADWHEIVARAFDIPSSTPVIVMQTIRFTPDGYFRSVGVTRIDKRTDYLPRFRQIVDSVTIK